METTAEKKLSFDETIDQIVKLANIVQPVGQWPARDRVKMGIVNAVRHSQTMTRAIRISEMKGYIPIENAANKLLDALKKTDSEALSFVYSADDIRAVERIRKGAHRIGLLAKTNPKNGSTGWERLVRNNFVRALLDAAACAGGQLSFNGNNPRASSIVKALELLDPYLPPGKLRELIPDDSSENSLITLKRIYGLWRKNAHLRYPWIKSGKKQSKKA